MVQLKKMTSREKAAATEVLVTALKELPDKWLACRDMRHAWEIFNDFHVTEVAQEKGSRVLFVARTLQCARCTTIRQELYVQRQWLEKVSQYYEYPDAYQIPGVPRGVKPSAIIQQEQYRRALEKVAKNARTT